MKIMCEEWREKKGVKHVTKSVASSLACRCRGGGWLPGKKSLLSNAWLFSVVVSSCRKQRDWSVLSWFLHLPAENWHCLSFGPLLIVMIQSLFHSHHHPCVGVKRACWWHLYIFMVVYNYFQKKLIILRPPYHPEFRCWMWYLLPTGADRPELTKWDFLPAGNYMGVFCRVTTDQLSGRFPHQVKCILVRWWVVFYNFCHSYSLLE